MMRVITGSARGRRLETLPGEDVTRPTTESVKEALFSMIQFDIEGRRVLDLFAGSGQLGIEALSRGARSCTFVENNRAAKQVVERNLAHCRLEEQANVVFSDALSFLNRSGTYDLVLLDVMLPGIDGFEVCRRIRATNASIGIIMLTARSQEMDKVTGLMTGADDYVTKPFSPAELTARVDALMRRSGGAAVDAGEIEQPPFLLNTRNRTLEKNGQRIKLTQVEYSIMKMFMENPGKALSREEILDLVWGHDYFGELKIVDVNIRRLRLKIEDNATNPTYITTVWGYGYKWGF